MTIVAKKYFPLLVYLIYSVSSIGLFFYGPFAYEISKNRLVLYLLVLHLSIIFGYKAGVNYTLKSRSVLSLNILRFLSIMMLR